MEKHIAALVGTSIARYEAVDKDGIPDFKIWIPGRSEPIWAECENARNQNYRSGGKVTHSAVETQKTRAARGDATTRYYDIDHFQILGVCLGKQTSDWTSFMFISTLNLARHANYPNKLAVMHRVPIPSSADYGPWSDDLDNIIRQI
jgi:hypothetical protein